MNRIKKIKEFGKIEEKNDDYFIFNGLLNCLSPQEILKAFDFDFISEILKRKLLVRKIISSIENSKKNLYIDFFEKILNNIPKLKTYHNKQACSQFLFDLYYYLSSPQQDRLIKYLLLSQYKNDRIRAYSLLGDCWDKKYESMLKKIFIKFYDFEALDLLIEKLDSKFLSKNIKNIYPLFSEEYLPFEELKLRNKLLIKIYKSVKDTLIKELKEKDPISYIFIAKECGLKVDEAFAFELFKKNSYKKNLISWYGQIGLWDTILKIKEFLTTQSS